MSSPLHSAGSAAAEHPVPDTSALPDEHTGRNLGLWPLVGLIVGSMIGAGIFNLPQQIAATAASGPMLLGWLVFGVGMIFLALTFASLGTNAPTVNGGVYGFAKDGFGDYIGFTTSWGYWLSTWLGSVGYLVMLFQCLGQYFGEFGTGTTKWAIAGASIVMWCVHFLILAGIRQATFINTFVSAAKIIPLVLFILLGITAWKSGLFDTDFWGHAFNGVDPDGEPITFGSVGEQIKGMMLLLVWFFLGIESVSIYAGRARDRSDARKATMIGFGTVLTLLVLVNVLSFGISQHARMSGYAAPSLASVMEDAVGRWGFHLIVIGVMVSVVGAYMSWMLLSSEILMYPGKDGNLPRLFGRENSRGVPIAALWLTSICMQLMLLWTLKHDTTYTNLTVLAGAMSLLPYLWSALYQVLIAGGRRHAYAEAPSHARVRDLVIGILATIFALFLMWAGGLDYLYVAAAAALVGTGLYAWARMERGKPVFRGLEWLVAAVVLVAGAYGIWALATEHITV